VPGRHITKDAARRRAGPEPGLNLFPILLNIIIPQGTECCIIRRKALTTVPLTFNKLFIGLRTQDTRISYYYYINIMIKRHSMLIFVFPNKISLHGHAVSSYESDAP